MSLDPDRMLSPDQFARLTPDQQRAYLDAARTEAERWTLTPFQARADAMADRCDETLAGGAAGPGKSNWLLHRAHRLSKEVPGHATLMLRSNFPKLHRTLIRESLVLFRTDPDVVPRWKGQPDREWHYPNGSLIEFGYCDSPETASIYLSAEYDLICWDELTEVDEETYLMVNSRARTTREKRRAGARPHVIGGTNPGNRGHAWVRKRLVDPCGFDGGSAEMPLDDGSTHVVGFVPGHVTDNSHIDPKYVQWLKQLPEHKRRMYLHGDWDVFEGMFFDGVSRETHSFSGYPPEGWPRFRGLDYGFSAPFGCVWGAVDPDGRLWIYRELKEAEWTAERQAKEIVAATTVPNTSPRREERVRWTALDRSAFHSGRGQGNSIAQQYHMAGLQTRPSLSERVPGWGRLHTLAAADPDARLEGWALSARPGGGPVPHLLISEDCPDLWHEITNAIGDENHPEDLDKKAANAGRNPPGDHLLDALRYLAMSLPPPRRGSGGVGAPRSPVGGGVRGAVHNVLGRR